MKNILLTLYLTIFTGSTYAQRANNVVAELDFNNPTTLQFTRNDTLRATLLITNGHMTIAREKPGYVVFRTKDTIYLDDRLRQFKAPVKVWGFLKAER